MKLNLARLQLHRNERGKARATLMGAHEAAPGRPEVLTALARIMLLDGEYDTAADTYRRALGLRPDDALARADLAACLLEMGQRDAGEASLRSAVRGRSPDARSSHLRTCPFIARALLLPPERGCEVLAGQDELNLFTP